MPVIEIIDDQGNVIGEEGLDALCHDCGCSSDHDDLITRRIASITSRVVTDPILDLTLCTDCDDARLDALRHIKRVCAHEIDPGVIVAINNIPRINRLSLDKP